MKVRDLTRRTAFRVALTFATLFLVTVAAIFIVLYQLITNEIEKKLKSHIAEVRETLVTAGRNDGFAALKKVITNKGPPTSDHEDIFLLTDEAGIFVAGNVDGLPQFTDWRYLPWKTLKFRGHATKLAVTTAALSSWTDIDKGFLLVGVGNGDIEEARLLILDSFAWGVALTLAGALIGGAWLGIGAQRRISRIEAVLAAASQGDLTARVPLTSAHDDLDIVSSQVNATLDHLHRVVEALGQVSADIAHDLKTPISRVQQRIDVALNQNQSSEGLRAAMAGIRGDLSGVIDTFEAILRIAQIEGGARKSRFKTVNVGQLVSSVVEAYEYVGEDTNHIIKLAQIPASVFDIHGDRDLLTQLFANLIENAIRHTPPGSHINISIARPADQVIIIFSDDGPGIPEAERSNVFRRLYRLDKSRSTPGSGLGLSLVAAIATLHNGAVTLEDNAPGLAVSVRLPAI